MDDKYVLYYDNQMRAIEVPVEWGRLLQLALEQAKIGGYSVEIWKILPYRYEKVGFVTPSGAYVPFTNQG